MGKKKKLEKYEKLLEKYKTKREIVKIFRMVTNGDADIHGMILEMSEDFMHLAENDEFKFNGEVIIRMDHFDAIRCNKFDKTIKKILKGEKRITKSKPKRTSIKLNSWNSIFQDLQKRDIHVIVECEDLKDPIFNIGPIEKINEKSLEIRFYSATGKYDDKPSRIN